MSFIPKAADVVLETGEGPLRISGSMESTIYPDGKIRWSRPEWTRVRWDVRAIEPYWAPLPECWLEAISR